MRELLRERELPPLLHLWETFLTLSRKRRNGFGPEAIGDDQIHYFQIARGITLHGWEIALIDRIDVAWFDVMVDKPARTKAPSAKPATNPKRGARHE